MSYCLHQKDVVWFFFLKSCYKNRENTSAKGNTYLKGIEIEIGWARSEQSVNLLLGGQHRVPLFNLLHLLENKNITTKTSKIIIKRINSSFQRCSEWCVVMARTSNELSRHLFWETDPIRNAAILHCDWEATWEAHSTCPYEKYSSSRARFEVLE